MVPRHLMVNGPQVPLLWKNPPRGLQPTPLPDPNFQYGEGLGSFGEGFSKEEKSFCVFVYIFACLFTF